MLNQTVLWHGSGGRAGLAELVTKTTLSPYAGGAVGIKNHRTQQQNPIPLILAGMPEQQTAIGLRLN